MLTMFSVANILLLIYAAIILVALSGNFLVCAAVFCDRILRQQQENLFLVSLAISDLLISLLVSLLILLLILGHLKLILAQHGCFFFL